MYYYRLRYYDPEAGRFVSRDPIGNWGDPGQRGNAQNYCGNNPVNFVDPLGADTLKPGSIVSKDSSLGGFIDHVVDDLLKRSDKYRAPARLHGRVKAALKKLKELLKKRKVRITKRPPPGVLGLGGYDFDDGELKIPPDRAELGPFLGRVPPLTAKEMKLALFGLINTLAHEAAHAMQEEELKKGTGRWCGAKEYEIEGDARAIGFLVLRALFANLTADEFYKHVTRGLVTPDITKDEAKILRDLEKAGKGHGCDFGDLRDKLTEYHKKKGDMDGVKDVFKDPKYKPKGPKKRRRPRKVS